MQRCNLPGMQLAEFRKAIGVSVRDVAEATHSTGATISRVERGIMVPRGDLLLRLNAWAEGERKRRRLTLEYRLDWSQLDEGAA